VPLVEVIGRQLGGHAAPGERQAGARHRHDRGRAPDRAQQVREHARRAQAHEHERDRQVPGAAGGGARWGGERDAEHAEHDRQHRQVLAPAGVLAQHPLGQEQEHQQARG